MRGLSRLGLRLCDLQRLVCGDVAQGLGASAAPEVDVVYAGFDVPDMFMVGYGLDYDGLYRNLRDVRELA